MAKGLNAGWIARGRSKPLSRNPISDWGSFGVKRRLAQLLLRTVGAGSLCAILAGAGWLLLINQPQFLFPNCVRAHSITLCSDKPVDAGHARTILADVAGRLRRAGLRWKGQRVAVIAQDPLLERLVFFVAIGGGGVNHYPYSKVAFVRPSIIRTNRLIAPDGTIIGPPRTLAYFVAHELAHGLHGEQIGAIGFFRAQRWTWEGAADFAAYAGTIDLQRNRQRLKQGHEAMNYSRSGLYDSYSSMVAFLIERCGWSLNDVLTSEAPEAQTLSAFAKDRCIERTQ